MDDYPVDPMFGGETMIPEAPAAQGKEAGPEGRSDEEVATCEGRTRPPGRVLSHGARCVTRGLKSSVNVPWIRARLRASGVEHR